MTETQNCIYCRVLNISVTDDTLSVDLEDGRTVSVPIGWYPRLAYGTDSERSNFEISGAGYGVHWPETGRRHWRRRIVARKTILGKPQLIRALVETP